MRYRLNKAISLFEVLIAVAIIATAITTVFSSFNSSISAARISQRVTRACLSAESSIWEIEEKYSDKVYPLVKCDDKDISCDYKITDTDIDGLKKLEFSTSWQQRRREKYNIDFFTYLLAKRND